MKLNLKLHGHTCVGGYGDEREEAWGFEITDSDSGIIIANFRMTAEELGCLLVSRTVKLNDVEVGFNEYTLARLGKVSEFKRQLVPMPDLPDGYHRKESDYDLTRMVKEACKPFEVDGWEARPVDTRFLS